MLLGVGGMAAIATPVLVSCASEYGENVKNKVMSDNDLCTLKKKCHNTILSKF